MLSRARLAAAGVLAVAVLAFAACGDAGETTTTTAPTSAVVEPPETTSAAPTVTVVEPPETTTAATTAEDDEEVRVAQDGDSVEVHYTGTLDDGSEFDSSRGRSPLSFVVGSGQVIAGFDDAVRGLAVGDSRTVRMEPEQAYGQPDPNLILEFPADQAPEGLAVGEKVTLSNGAPGTVVEITDEVVRIDANHVLAGQALTFAVELVSLG
jgi:FKBP-type peptidyl-prolyl cis-trans isomerase 2